MTSPETSPLPYYIKLGLWGASGSGKSTYLAALRPAADQNTGDPVKWNVILEGESLARLSPLIGRLTNDGEFPPGTQGKIDLDLVLIGRRRNDPRLDPGGRATDAVFDVNLIDADGAYYRDDTSFDPSSLPEGGDELELYFDGATGPPPERGAPEQTLREVIDHLATSRGIIYLFDPVADREANNSWRNFNAMLMQLEARVRAAGGLIGPHLPHHVAVCITKFDDESVFRAALSPEEIEKLRGEKTVSVPSEVAKNYFARLCGSNPRGRARLVRDALNAHFLPHRVRYFATSSVGVWMNERDVFDPGDWGNTTIERGVRKVRGTVRPMNVLEPMTWLVSRIRKAERARPV